MSIAASAEQGQFVLLMTAERYMSHQDIRVKIVGLP